MAEKNRSLTQIVVPLSLAFAILALLVTIFLIFTNPSQIPVNNNMPQPTLASEQSANFLINKAKQDLTDRIEITVTAEEIEVIKAEKKSWSDSSLGCPQPGMVYAQVITPGYQIILEAKGDRYDYRTDLKGNIKLCP